MKLFLGLLVVAITALAVQVRAEPAPAAPMAPAAVQRNFPGPIVNGQRRQPTPREISERQRAESSSTPARSQAPRQDPELDAIFRALNAQQGR